MDCVVPNPWAQALVKARGFNLQRSLTRMYRGKNSFAGQTNLAGAIVGPEFG